MSNKKNRGLRNEATPIDEAVVEETMEESVEEVTEEVIEGPVIEPPTEPLYGVINCERLRIRKEPHVAIDNVVALVTRNTEVMVDPDTSDDQWCHVYTSAGLDGYCMRDYVTIKR